jgi:hypothetical protein
VIRIACLHTAASNAALFDAAAGDGVALRHALREDLLRDAEAAGGLTPGIQARATQELRDLEGQADAVLLTCSTIGPAIAGTDALRADAALAEAAMRDGGHVAVLCAVETTLGPTGAIFGEAAGRHGATMELRLVPGAWAAFRGGDPARYRAIIREAAEAALAEGADRVALGQVSMTGAEAGNPRILAAPAIAIAAACERAKAR